MPIENLAIAHGDLERRGGIQYVGIGLLDDASAVSFTNTAGTAHAVSFTAANPLELFDLKQGTGSLSTSGSKEGGTILFEHTVSFFVPNMSSAHLRSLDAMKNEHIVVVAQGYDGNTFCIGLSEAYELEDSTLGNVQMFATLSSIEGATGAALGDESGVTVTITCSSGELPRASANTLTLNTANGTMTLS